MLKTQLTRHLVAFALTLAAVQLPAAAALTDFTDYGLGGTTASWDIFDDPNYVPVFTFATGTAGNPITNADTNLNLVATVPGWMPGPPTNGQAMGPTGSDSTGTPGNRESFYTFFASTVNFSITSYVAPTSSVTTFTLQAANAADAAFASLSLNGNAPTTSGTSDNVNFWTWDSLTPSEGQALALNFSVVGQHQAIDAVQIQTNGTLTAVPEPGAIALLATAALTTLTIFLRQRKSAPIPKICG